jgi:phage-related protein
VVILFNGFQKKTQKTPEKEIKKAITLKNEYYAHKE